MTDLTKITTPFGLLDLETQKALRAHGGPYEVYSDTGGWRFSPTPAWLRSMTYRVIPGPKKAREVGWRCIDGDGAIFRATSHNARWWDEAFPSDAPHRVVRLIEWPKDAPLPDLPEGYE